MARRNLKREQEALGKVSKQYIIQSPKKEKEAADALRREGKPITQEEIYQRAYGSKDTSRFATPEQTQKSIYGEAYGTSYPTFEEDYGVSKLRDEIDKITGRLEKRQTTGESGYLARVKKSLKKESPYYGMTEQEMMAKYGTPGSESYIENPYARASLVERGTSGVELNLQNYLDKMKEMYGLETGRTQQVLSAKEKAYQRAVERYNEQLGLNESKAKSEAEAAAAEAKRQAELEDYMRKKEIDAMFKTGRSGGSGSGGDITGGLDEITTYAQAVLDGQLDLSSVPQKIRIPVIAKYNELAAQQQEQQQQQQQQEEEQQQPSYGVNDWLSGIKKYGFFGGKKQKSTW